MITLRPIPTPMPYRLEGWYQVSNDTYHNQAPGLSSSGLKLMARSPAHYACRDKYQSTPAMEFGTAVHAAILEPDLYARAYETFPDDTRFTQKLKDDCKARDMTPIKRADADKVQAIAEAVRSHPDAAALLSGGIAEASGFWMDKRTGMTCKLRADWINPDLRVVVDLKTTSNSFGAKNGIPASPEAWATTVARYDYHWQAAWYLEGISQIEKEPWRDWVWIVIETEPPHVVGVYQASRDMIYQGAEEIKPVLELYADCMRRNQWPAPAYGLTEIALPEWRVRMFDSFVE